MQSYKRHKCSELSTAAYLNINDLSQNKTLGILFMRKKVIYFLFFFISKWETLQFDSISLPQLNFSAFWFSVRRNWLNSLTGLWAGKNQSSSHMFVHWAVFPRGTMSKMISPDMVVLSLYAGCCSKEPLERWKKCLVPQINFKCLFMDFH